MKLLVVEDDRYVGQIIVEYLADNGLQATVVRTAEQALKAPLDGYACAIVDVMLPNDPARSGISEEESRSGFATGIALSRRLMEKRLPVVLLSSVSIGGEASQWANENGVPYVLKHEPQNELLAALAQLGVVASAPAPRSFIVHGHDEQLLLELKDYIQNNLGWPEPTILREKKNAGKTIIEKFEEEAGRVDWVFILLSPDEESFDSKTNDEKRRTRQNVIFELGFFYGLMGRNKGRVMVLKKGPIELPSDIDGVIWINVENGIRASGEDIRREMSGIPTSAEAKRIT